MDHIDPELEAHVSDAGFLKKVFIILLIFFYYNL